jgi:hypothetical protein
VEWRDRDWLSLVFEAICGGIGSNCRRERLRSGVQHRTDEDEAMAVVQRVDDGREWRRRGALIVLGVGRAKMAKPV